MVKCLKVIEVLSFYLYQIVLMLSPRVITEALLTDLPILVNENILGGWKYVNEKTGVFFRDEHDISMGS